MESYNTIYRDDYSASSASPPSLLDAALSLAAAGLPVFPCKTNKRPIFKGSFKLASTDPAVIRNAFTHPQAKLIGVPTGPASGFDVLDLDPRHGSDVWKQANLHLLPETRVHQTMNGGEHWLFRHVEGVVNDQSGRIGPGVDVRGDGGYIIAPPSPGYTAISEAAIADWHPELLALALKPPKAAASERPATKPDQRIKTDQLEKRHQGYIRKILDNVRRAQDGSKHHILRNSAYLLGGLSAAAGITEGQTVASLLAALPASVKDWKLAENTAKSSFQLGQGKPFDLPDRPKPNGHRRPPNAESAQPEADDLGGWAPPAELPTIVVRAGERHLAADAGLAAMHHANIPFYRRDKALVRILPIDLKLADGADVLVPALVPVTTPVLMRALGRSAQWSKFNHESKQVSIDPPTAVAEQIMGMIDEWPFQPLRGVIATQTLRYDGSLLTEPGYDPATGLVLFNPPLMAPIPNCPSKRDALEALDLLNDLLAEFVFAEDGNVSRSAAMSMIMTAVLRGAMPVAPMHVITKPEAGTGGSYLQDLVAAIAIGERCPVVSFMPDDDAENEKRLAAAALTQQPMIALDNLSSVLMGDFLCQLISQPVLQIRQFGRLELVSVVNSAFVTANGNNLVIGADTVRRTVQITLDADMENPEARSFTRNPVAEVLADRGRYVGAVLTIARAHRADGWARLPARAGFEGWSNIVRSALVWLGWPDPVQSVEKVRAEDPVRGALFAVVDAWASELQINIGYHSSELIRFASEWNGSERVRPALWDALFTVAGGKGEQIDPAKLGLWLNTNLNRVIAGHKLVVDRETNKARPRWLLVPR